MEKTSCESLGTDKGYLSLYVAVRTHTGLGMWGDIMLLGNLFGDSSGTFIGHFRPVRAKVTLHSSNMVEMPVHMGTRHTELPCYQPVSGLQPYSGSCSNGHSELPGSGRS